MLVSVAGTPLENGPDIDPFDFIRTVAAARIMMPTSYVRLSAGREQMSEQTQAMCFMAGANSIFYGCRLLTTPNPEKNRDLALLEKLGLETERGDVKREEDERLHHLAARQKEADTELYYNAAR